jgi:hypothetical protein
MIFWYKIRRVAWFSCVKDEAKIWLEKFSMVILGQKWQISFFTGLIMQNQPTIFSSFTN